MDAEIGVVFPNNIKYNFQIPYIHLHFDSTNDSLVTYPYPKEH